MGNSISLLPAAAIATGVAFEGKVSRVSPLQVTLDCYGSRHEYPGGDSAATWVAAGQTPARGDRVLVIRSDTLAVWVFPAAAMALITLEMLAPSLLASGTAGPGDEALRALGTGASTAAPGNHTHAPAPVLTALPGAPANGDEVVLQTAAMAALSPPIAWQLKYLAAAGKWLYLGGAPLFARGAGATTASTTYAAIGGASVTLPVAGTYDVDSGAGIQTAGSAGQVVYLSFDIGATGAVDGDAAIGYGGAATTPFEEPGVWPLRKALAAVTLTQMARVTLGAAATIRGPWLRVTPVLLG